MIAVGDTLAQWEFEVEAGKVREFARAVSDTAGGDRPTIAPPTFPVVISAGFVARLVTEILALDRSRTVHGEQQYEYFAPIRAGDRLRCRARLASDEMKEGRRGGAMRILRTETEYVSLVSGKLVCREVSTTIEKARGGQ